MCVLLVACDVGEDQATQGFHGPCADPAGSALGCEPVAIETAEDACWKLVECAAIPLDNGDARDWDDCVARVQRMDAPRRSFALACVEAATCDDLRVPGSPINPQSYPPCFAYGSQQQ